MRRLQYTTALFFVCAYACVAMAEAHRCIHHELAMRQGSEPLPLSVEQEVPGDKREGWHAHSAAASDWAPIRIGVFAPDMEDPTRYCTQEGQSRPDFTGRTVKCSERDVFTEAKRTALVTRILPAAIQLHRDRLLVKPVKGNIMLPKFAENNICSMFSIPKTHSEAGVSGVDMVLYAAAGPTQGATLAWATSCAQEAGGRPVIGAMNFGPHSVEETSRTIRVTAHEIAHALGFDYFTFAAKGMVSDPLKVRGKASTLMVKSSKTLEKTREHFGCPTAAGMELEDEGGEGTQLSHWERRNAKDELMAGMSGLGVYSALTMAAFEDLGYYRANWGREEPMIWGRNKGCDLLTKPCVSKGKTDFPDMFCTSKLSTKTCTSDRRTLGICSIEKFTKPLPPQFQYFQDPTVGGAESSDLTDFCPYIYGFSDTSCASGLAHRMVGSLIGPNSRCLKGEGLIMDEEAVGDICADVSCEKDGTVRVRYLGDDTWHKCTDGKGIEPSATFSKGKILCPRYEEVCVA